MKLKYEVAIQQINKEFMAVPIGNGTEFHGVIRMNETTAEIVKLLGKETTIDEIVSELKKQYDADENIIRSSVEKVLETLKKEGLVE